MAELTRRLAALPEGERRDALQYYEEYFDDAGPDMEGAVLAELKSPAAVAARLGGWSGPLEDMAGADRGQSDRGQSGTAEQSQGQTRTHREQPFTGRKT